MTFYRAPDRRAPSRFGTPTGSLRIATVRGFDARTGIVTIALDDGDTVSTPKKFPASIVSSWSGPNGEFIGGYPEAGASVIVSQGYAGEWRIISYWKSDKVFEDESLMTALRPGRALIQSKNGNRIFVDPNTGIHAGNHSRYLQANPRTGIISHNFPSQMSFTESSRKISGTIKRDTHENSNRNILGSTLDSQSYDESLRTISMDPTFAPTRKTKGLGVRNLPLAEQRELTYEFANSFDFTTDEDEYSRYTDPREKVSILKVNRRKMRSDALSMSLEYPNHLIETIKGTVVDTFGNILDINRAPLPIGKVDSLSLANNPDKNKAFSRIRAQLRKSIAFHWELNARKGTSDTDSPVNIPDTRSSEDYARDRSRFYFDLDKEGQFKLNIPASSEIGNVPLLTRYENFSVLLSKEDASVSPNSFVREENNEEIFLESFAAEPTINLSGSDDALAGYKAPVDRITKEPIKYGTAHHDITKTCSEFLVGSSFEQAGRNLVNFYEGAILNKSMEQLPKIVTDTLVVSGPDADAGGRSGVANLDGHLSLNIGANTVDRQSLWVDCAGAVISRIGRDKQGISYACSLDGHMMLQSGGPGIGDTYDSRFKDEYSGFKDGSIDVRVWIDGQLAIFKMGARSDGSAGIDITCPGNISIISGQHLILKAIGDIKLDGDNIICYADSTKRIIKRHPSGTIG
jgi:hypothetical protein